MAVLLMAIPTVYCAEQEDIVTVAIKAAVYTEYTTICKKSLRPIN